MDASSLFSPNDLESLQALLLRNNYPVKLVNGSLAVPNQYIVQIPSGGFLKNNGPSPQMRKWLREMEKGKECVAEVRLWNHSKNTTVRIGEVTTRAIQLCRCCPFMVIEVIGDQPILDALNDRALLSPGGDNTPTGSMLAVMSINAYAFSSPGGDNSRTGSLTSSDNDVLAKAQSAALEGLLHPREEQELSTSWGEGSHGMVSGRKEPVRVAVIDSGFRATYLQGTGVAVSIWRGGSQTSACGITGDEKGWNFVGRPTIAEITGGIREVGNQIVNDFENGNPDDDHFGHHGTLVSAIITDTARQTSGGPSPSIMVLKAFDSKGIGTLFTVLCALCYAQEHEADIINASFVIPATGGIELLERCLTELEDRNILLVCAAGNRPNRHVQRGTELAYNLFPACYSETYRNIITATTIWEEPDQTQDGLPWGFENYSDRFVNIAIQANHPQEANDGYYLFPRNGNGNRFSFAGSSFATAYMSGMAAAVLQHHYGASTLTATHLRETILYAINPRILSPTTGFIKNGRYKVIP
ncbi:S8 family peptidase [Tellurirhabdus rosea]|uniref:S8 family peptidase n=1 Tax=Tellurirhabdus rosea TaxID=2674997 RepID=UPI002258B507|nr:S8 family serine peptidase [Tellurirhabdus rosea]